jgi:hypothetical protein
MTGKKDHDPTLADDDDKEKQPAEDIRDKANPPPDPVPPADPDHKVKDKVKETPVQNTAPNPPSTPGLPVPHAAGPANSAPLASSSPAAPVQSWLVPPLGTITPHESDR